MQQQQRTNEYRGDGKKTVLRRERLIGGTLENLPYKVKERLG